MEAIIQPAPNGFQDAVGRRHRITLGRLFDPMPANLRRTQIIDNGTTNALYYYLSMAPFFCNVRAADSSFWSKDDD